MAQCCSDDGMFSADEACMIRIQLFIDWDAPFFAFSLDCFDEGFHVIPGPLHLQRGSDRVIQDKKLVDKDKNNCQDRPGNEGSVFLIFRESHMRKTSL